MLYKQKIFLILAVVTFATSCHNNAVKKEKNDLITNILDQQQKLHASTKYSWIFDYRGIKSIVEKKQIKKLSNILQHSNDEIEKLLLVLVLAEMGPKATDAFPVLYPLLLGVCTPVPVYAQMAILRMDKSIIKKICKKVYYPKNLEERQCRGSGLYVLVEFAPFSITEVMKYAKEENIKVRCSAIYTLGQMGKKAHPAKSLLMQFTEGDHDELVKLEAAYALWRIMKWNKSIPLITNKLANSNRRVCSTAILYLKHIGPPARAALPMLKKLLIEKIKNKKNIKDWFENPITESITKAIKSIENGQLSMN